MRCIRLRATYFQQTILGFIIVLVNRWTNKLGMDYHLKKSRPQMLVRSRNPRLDVIFEKRI